MAYGKRKADYVNNQGFKKKMRRGPTTKWTPRIRTHKVQNNTDSMTVRLTKLTGQHMAANTDFNGVAKVSDIVTCEGWSRYADFYAHFKVLGIKVQFMPTDKLLSAYTCVQSDDDATMTNTVDYLKQRSLNIHNLQNHAVNHSRYFNLQHHSKFADFQETSKANAYLVSGTSLDAGLKFQVEGPRDSAGAEIKVVMTYIVQFQGIQGHVQTDPTTTSTLPIGGP